MLSITNDLQSTFTQYEKTFKALADEKRLRILYLLANTSDDSICVCDLADEMDLAQSKLSYHLKILLQAKLIIQEKKGTWNHYSLNHKEINSVLSEELCCLFRKSNAESFDSNCSCS